MGAKVGLMDADVYGPNIPMMMGVEQLPPQDSREQIIPAETYGVKMISIGFMVKPDQPIVWRGPMLHSAIQQFVRDVVWGDLDYLVVDLPPGTGDAQLSLVQTISVTGGVIVTLPQARLAGGCPPRAGDVPPDGDSDRGGGRKYELPGTARWSEDGYLWQRRR